MEIWQVVAMVVLVVLPITLLLDLHPQRERLTSRGKPLTRMWERADHPGADAARDEHLADPHPVPRDA